MNRRFALDASVFAVLVVGGAVLRIALQEIPNFAPVAALALFSGYFFRRRRVAVLVPLLVMGLSDLSIGGYDWRVMATVYGMLAVPVFCGDFLRRVFVLAPDRWTSAARSTAGLIGCSLLSAGLFFVFTNLAVWLCFDLYQDSAAGLLECYVQALPFFRYTLAGDLSFSTLLFSSYALAVTTRLVAAPTLVPAV